MSRRNTRQGKARRRAERDRRRGTATSGQGPQAVEVRLRRFWWHHGQAVLVPGTRVNAVLGYVLTRTAA